MKWNTGNEWQFVHRQYKPVIRLERIDTVGHTVEALDCRVYARAAAAVYGIDRFQEEHWKALDELLAYLPRPGTSVVPKPPHAREVSRPPWIDKERTRNWFSK